MEFLKECKIPDRYRNIRIDLFLAKRYGYLSRSEWQKEIARGKITINGSLLARYDRKIRPGDVISYAGRDAAEPEVDRGYSVLFEDDQVLGINKPGNLPVHPAGVFYHNTLLTILQNKCGRKLHLAHRLDRETSGVVVLAKDPVSAARMYESFASVRKTYLALVHGVPRNLSFEVDVPIDFDAGSRLEHKRIAQTGARETARTLFTIMKPLGNYCLVKAVPLTGRQHQIRVHLKYAGYPIMGDKLYGTDERFYETFVRRGPSEDLIRAIGFPRSALHSRSLVFRHPVTDKEILLKAPLPDDMRSFISREQERHV